MADWLEIEEFTRNHWYGVDATRGFANLDGRSRLSSGVRLKVEVAGFQYVLPVTQYMAYTREAKYSVVVAGKASLGRDHTLERE